MKRRDLIKKLEDNGWWFVREGDSHSIYTNEKKSESIPRHREVSETLSRAILKRNGIK